MATSDKMSRNIMERVKKSVGVVPRYASGTARLFLASGAEFFKNEMPAPVAMIQTNQDLLNDAVRFLRNPVDAINKQVDRALGSDDFKALQRFAKYALDDLKTGNLYDPVRDRSELGMQIDADLASFGGMDLGNFDENGDWIEGADSSDDDITIEIAKIQDKNDSKRTEATIDAIGASTNAIVSTNNANAQMDLRMSIKQHSQQMQALENMITAQTSTFELINKSVQASMNVTREAHNQLVGKLDEMTGLLQKIADGVAPKPEKKEYKEQEDIFGLNGELNIKQYMKRVMQNIDDKYAVKSILSNATMGMGVKGLLELVQDNPWQIIASQIIQRIIPESAQKQMARTNKNLESFMPALLQKLGERGRAFDEGRSDKFSDLIAGMFGVTPRSRASIDTAYENPVKQAAFTSKTARAIEEVIPMWLARIDSHISGSPLMVYNYKTGRLENTSRVVANYERSTRDLVGRMGDSASEILDRAAMYKFEDSDQQKKFLDFVYRYLQKQGEENRFINPYQSVNDFKATMPDSESRDLYYNLLTGILTTMPRDKIMQASRDILGARQSRDRNTFTVNNELKDSGLIAAWSGFMDQSLQNRITSESTKGRSGLTDIDIDRISKDVHDRAVSQGGVQATNILLADIVRTLRGGIITYSYNLGKRANIEKLPDYVKARAKAADDASSAQYLANQNATKRQQDIVNNHTRLIDAQHDRTDAERALNLSDEDKLFVNLNTSAMDAAAFQAAINFGNDSREDPDNPVVVRRRQALMDKVAELNGPRDKVLDKTGVRGAMSFLRKAAEEPFRLFSEGLRLTDAFMFKMLFGEDAASNLELNGEPYLLQTLTHSLNVHFKNATDWFAANVGNPMKKYLLDEKTGLLPRIGSSLKDIVGWDDKKSRLRGAVRGLKERIVGTRDADANGKPIGDYRGGRFSNSINKVRGYGDTIGDRITGAVDHLLYGDYADGSRKGVGYQLVQTGTRTARGSRMTRNGMVEYDEEVPVWSAKAVYGGAIGKLRQGFDGLQDFLFGDDDSREKWNKVKRNVNEALPDMIVGGGIGMLTSIFLPGGPILGGLIGSGMGLIKGSEDLKRFLFGELTEETVRDRNGNPVIDPDTGKPKTRKSRKGNLISQEVYDGFKQYAPKVTMGAVAGSIAGGLGLLPFGLGSVAGAAIGSVGGMLGASDAIRTMIFGDGVDPDSGLISKNFKDKVKDQVKKYAPASITGALAGAGAWGAVESLGLIPGLSLIPGGPIFGMLGGLVGMSNADKFNQFLFGEEVETEEDITDANGNVIGKKKKKKREGGAFGGIFDFAKNKLITPLAKKVDEVGKNIGSWFHKDILGPLDRSIGPLKRNLVEAGVKIRDSLLNIGDHITRGILSAFNIHIGGSLKDFFHEKIIPRFENTANKFFSAIGKVIGGIISAPFKALEFMVTGTIKGSETDDSAIDDRKKERERKRSEARSARRAKHVEKNAERTGRHLSDLFKTVGKFFGFGDDAGNTVTNNIAPNQVIDSNGRVRGRANNASTPSIIQLGPGGPIISTSTNDDGSTKVEPVNDTSDKTKKSKTSTVTDSEREKKSDTDESDAERNRKRNRLGKRRSDNSYLAEIAAHTRSINSEIKGQLGGTGWNIAYIKTLLEMQFGPLSDDQLPDEMEGSKKVKKKRGFFGKFFGAAGDWLSDKKDRIGEKFGKLGRGAKRVGSAVGGFFQLVFHPIKFLGSMLTLLGQGIGKVASGLWDAAKLIGSGIVGALKTAGKFIEGAAKGVGSALGNVLSLVTGSIKDLGLALTATARGIIEFVADSIPDVGRFVVKSIGAIGSGLFKLGKGAIKGIGKGASAAGRWIKNRITGKKSESNINEVIRNIGTFTIEGGHLDKVGETVIRIGNPLAPVDFPVLRMLRGRPLDAITYAVPVYVAGTAADSGNSRKDLRFKEAYKKADRAAESSSNPAEAYDKAVDNAKTSDEIQAIALASQMNDRKMLALPGATSKSEDEDGGFFSTLLSTLTNGAGSGLLGKAAAALGGTKLGSLLAKGSGILGAAKSFLGTATKGMLPLALGTAVGMATGTEDRALTGGVKMATLPIFNLLTNGTKTASGATGMLKATGSWIKNGVGKLLGFTPKATAEASGDLLSGMGKVGWNQKIANAIHNLGVKIMPKAAGAATETGLSTFVNTADDAARAAAKTGLLGKVGKAFSGVASAAKSKLGSIGSTISAGIDAAKNNTGILGKVVNSICNLAQKAMNHPIVKKIMPSTMSSKLGSVLTSFRGKLGKVMAEVTSETLEQFAKKLGIIVTVVTTAYDIVSGYNEAANILKIDSTNLTIGMRISAGLAKGLSGLAFGLIPVSWLTETIYKIFADDDSDAKLDQAQTDFKEAAARSGMSLESYNNQQNKTTWQSIKDTTSAAASKVSEVATSAVDKVKSAMSSFTSAVSNFFGGKGRMKTYTQTAAKWNRQDSTMHDTGCGPTVAAMVESAYGRNSTPIDADRASYQLGMRQSDGSTNPEFFGKYAAGKNYGMNVGPTSSGMIQSNLAKGRPVVMMGKGGDFGPEMHYLVADRMVGKGKVSIRDPYTGATKQSNIGNLVRNTSSTIYSYGRGPGDSTSNTNAQNALVNAMAGIQGKLAYSRDWDKQDPDKGVASCASTVGWAYKKVIGGDFLSNPMSAGSTTQAKDSRFKTIWVNDGSTPLNTSILQPGDTMYFHWNQSKYDGNMQHTEMYAGNNQDWSHGGNPAYGPVLKDLDSYRKTHLMMVRRYAPFVDGKTVTYSDADLSAMNFGAYNSANSGDLFQGDTYYDRALSLLSGVGSRYDSFIGRLFGQKDETSADGTSDGDSYNSTGINSTTNLSSITGTTEGEKIYNYLIGKGLTKNQVYGIMGNLYAESGLHSNNLQNSYEKSLGLSDTTYTNAVNNGSYKNFSNDSAGYGLAQWTSSGRKAGLLSSAKTSNKGIDDLSLQLDYLWNELNGSYKNSVLDPISRTNSIRDASTIFMQKFEVPKGYKTNEKIEERAAFANQMAQTYGTGPRVKDLSPLPQLSSWGTGSGNASANLSSMNDRIRRINRMITKTREEANQAETATQITTAITNAVDKATSSDQPMTQVLQVLTSSLSTMIELLSDIKKNTARNDADDDTTSTSKSNIPTVRADHFDSDSGVGTNKTDVGARIIDNLTSK